RILALHHDVGATTLRRTLRRGRRDRACLRKCVCRHCFAARTRSGRRLCRQTQASRSRLRGVGNSQSGQTGIMRIRGLGRLRVVAGRIQNRLSPGTLILLYHRVAELPLDPLLLTVTPAHFEEHLQVLSRVAKPLSLRTLVRSLQANEVTLHGVVITFDDGAADNLHNAKPLLERYNIPATVFVATEYSKGEREFWWDELERLLLASPELPESLNLKLNGTSVNWKANDSREQLYQHLGDSLRLL